MAQRRDKAKAVREELVKVLAPLAADLAQPKLATDWWFLATVSEAYFGLGDYEKAREWILRARDQEQPADWGTGINVAPTHQVGQSSCRGWTHR